MQRYPEELTRITGRIAAIACVILTTVLAQSQARAEPQQQFSAADLSCLALNVYHEARNQPLEGQLAVAHVTLNRLEASRPGTSICEVVFKGRDFSWTSDPEKLTSSPTDATAWTVAKWVARMAVAKRDADPVRGSTYFHASTVAPRWARGLVRVTKIGDHIFYAKHASAAEPHQLAEHQPEQQ